LKDIFVGICFSLTKSKSIIFPNKNHDINKEDCLALDINTINDANLNFVDELSKSSEKFEITFAEFAPKVFKILRKLENVEEDELIK
jgi:hypothetical protein